MEDTRNIDFHFQFLYWMKIKWTKTTQTPKAASSFFQVVH